MDRRWLGVFSRDCAKGLFSAPAIVVFFPRRYGNVDGWHLVVWWNVGWPYFKTGREYFIFVFFFTFGDDDRLSEQEMIYFIIVLQMNAFFFAQTVCCR